MAIEAGVANFANQVGDLITKASGIFKFPDEPASGRFSSPLVGRDGDFVMGALFRQPEASEVRIVAIKRPEGPMGRVAVPFISLTLGKGSIINSGEAVAHFVRVNSPGEEDLNVYGPDALPQAATYLQFLHEAVVSQRLFPQAT